MCLIIHKTKNQRIEHLLAEDVAASNPHGWGVMYMTTRGLRTIKGMDMAEYYANEKKWQDKDAMVHFRYTTHGETTVEMAHPFHVIDDIYLMHNGVLNQPEYQCPQGILSDTALFALTAREILEMG